MITRPFELESHLSPPPRDLDAFAWVNVGVIVLFFSLLGSPYVLAPGPLVDVSRPGAIDLPQAGMAAEGTRGPSVVVSYRRDNVILFEGGMYTLPELKKHMEGYAKKHPGAVMLVLADRQVSVQDFLKLCDAARALGFASVQAAAAPPDDEHSLK